MCRMLSVSVSGYYGWRPTGQCEVPLRRDVALPHRGDLRGAPWALRVRRIHAELARSGVRVGYKRVHRLMGELGLRSVYPRSYQRNTLPSPRGEHLIDLVNRQVQPPARDLSWVGDITYLRTWTGWAYLATVIDCHSRKIVGWAVADHMRAELVTSALAMALTRRRPAAGVIFHSDRASQGGFNWSSQHLERGGGDGQAGGVVEGVDRKVGDEVAGSTVTAAGGGAPVLA